MISYLVNKSLLLVALNIDVVVCIKDANLLVPHDDRQHPVAAVPAARRIVLLVELPLTAAWNQVLVTELARNGHVTLVRALHIQLPLVGDFRLMAQTLNRCSLLHEPASEVCHFVVSDLDLVLCHC